MELNITENLEKSVLLPLYTQENELNSDGMSAAEKLGLDTGNFYLDSQNRNEKNTQIPFYNEVEIIREKNRRFTNLRRLWKRDTCNY